MMADPELPKHLPVDTEILAEMDEVDDIVADCRAYSDNAVDYKVGWISNENE